MNELRRPIAGVGCAALVAIFFVAVAAYGLAYQAKPSYFIQVGARVDRPYLEESTFFTREPAEKDRTPDRFDYRFTNNRSPSLIDLPGIGSQAINLTLRVNSSENPNPQFKVYVNNTLIDPALTQPPPQNQWKEIVIPVRADMLKDGSLHLKLDSSTWRPKGDSRELGILLDWVKVEPTQPGFLSPGVRPPDDKFIPLILVTVLSVLIFLTLGIPAPYALLGGFGVIGGFSFWLVNDRLSLTTFIAENFLRTMFFLWVGVFLLVELMPRLFRLLGINMTRREVGWLTGFFLLGLVLLLGGQLDPQFTSSDIGLNVRVLQSQVLKGMWVDAEPLPNNQLAPYPPAYYISLIPFTALLDGSRESFETLFKVASSLLQASGVFMVFYLSSLIRRPQLELSGKLSLAGSHEYEPDANWAGLVAAGFYSISKYPFLIFSQGNHANLFGAWAFLVLLCTICGTLTYLRSPWQLPALPRSPQNALFFREKEDEENLTQRFFVRQLQRWQNSKAREIARTRLFKVARYLLPLVVLFVVLVGHYGTFIFSNAFIICLILVLLLLGGTIGRREALYLAVIYFSGIALALALYYYNFIGLIGEQLGRSLGEKAPPDIKPRAPFDFFNSISRVYSDGRVFFGLLVLLVAVGGAVLWLVGYLERRNWHWFRAGVPIYPVSAVLLALGLTCVAFAFLERIQGIESRFQLYLIPLIALAAGNILGRVWRSGMGGVALVSALFLFQLTDSLAFWLDRITYYFY